MRTFKLESFLKELRNFERINGVKGFAIVNRNGILIASSLTRNIDDSKFAAMAATMHGAMETAMTSIESNEVCSLTVEFSNYQVITINIGDQAIFIGLLELTINLGLALIEIEEIITKILGSE